MKFAHLADIHLGGWREPKLQELGYNAFQSAIALCITKNVDFVLIAGDLFNTALPAIEALKIAVEGFKKLQQCTIPIYLIAGSHDYSPSGKSMLEVLEKTGLFVNVSKGEIIGDKLNLRFTRDEKTGAKITGILGKRAGLDKGIYEELLREPLEQEQGYKIFMFHNLLAEFKTEELEKAESAPVSLLPKGFDYYAGGHVHIVERKELPGYRDVVYPGPLFPNSFSELEKLKKGGFFIVEDGKLERIDIEMKKVVSLDFSAEGKSAEEVEREIREDLKDVQDAIVTVRVEGTLMSGKPAGINFKEIFEMLYGRGAYYVMKNITKLASKEFEAIKVEQGTVDEIEAKLIKEHLGKIRIDGADEEQLIVSLMRAFSSEKLDGEKVADYERRVREDIKKILPITSSLP